MMKRWLVIELLGIFVVGSLAHAATFTLEWDPNTEPDLAGYKLYYGTASRSYDHVIDVGNITTYQVSGLRDGVTYYFAVTAYDTANNESGYSNEVSGRKNLPPQASAAASPTSGKAPLTLSFSGSGSDSDGTIVAYHWDFGDGATSEQQNPSHTYSTEGVYTVTLTVTDNDGATGTDTLQIQVQPSNQAPSVTLVATPTAGSPPLNVVFTANASDSDGTIVAYHWDFGDGATSEQQNPSHTYSTEGVYTVTLTVTDNDGATASDSVTITVDGAPTPPKGLRLSLN